MCSETEDLPKSNNDFGLKRLRCQTGTAKYELRLCPTPTEEI
jgi:hypothetical protein